MLTPKLNNCVSKTCIPSVLQDIDCKLTDLAKKQYVNIVYELNKPINYSILGDLLNYKRILTYRYCNEDYASPYTTEEIIGKVKLLIYK